MGTQKAGRPRQGVVVIVRSGIMASVEPVAAVGQGPQGQELFSLNRLFF
jgi:hypothetical protein